MIKITDEELDKFIEYAKSQVNKQQTSIGSMMVAEIAMMGDELKLRRTGKIPGTILPDYYLDIMIRDNRKTNAKGSKEIIQICRELKPLRKEMK